MRIGHGYDVHRVSDDASRPLMLGLVRVSDGGGLVGHSDADVVTHAVLDALLGASGLGDLGEHFSDRDEQWRGADSALLLARVRELVHAAGFVATSVDVTVVAERPRLAGHKSSMATALSAALGCAVSVKATTNEGLDAIGRGEAIAAYAVCLLEEIA